MKKQSILVLALGVFVGTAWAQTPAPTPTPTPAPTTAEANQRNASINRVCTDLALLKHAVPKTLSTAERASRVRQYSTEIEACYRAHALEVSAPANSRR